MDFVMPKYVSLKGHSTYDERWLHERILENPSLLGLGDLDVRASERPQQSGGRLDLLLFNPETDTRYEVELQLGATDESHIIRTIEYWDIERKRYPQYEHIAVIAAEDVTSRFLNVIGLFNQAIPLIAIQLKAVIVDDTLTLVATQILGLMSLGTDDEDEGETVDRSYWEAKSSTVSLRICDQIVGMIADVESSIQAKYTKHYIGLIGSGGVKNFVTLRPRKSKYAVAEFRIPFDDNTDQKIDQSNLMKLPYVQKHNQFRVRVHNSDLTESREIILQLIRQAHEHSGIGA